MKYLKIKDWTRWQKWKPGKHKQTWIQVWLNLFTNEDWLSLSDAEKGQLVSMWVAAVDKNGQLPKDPEIIRKMSFLDTAPDLNRFHHLGFIEGNLTNNSSGTQPKTLSNINKDKLNKDKTLKPTEKNAGIIDEIILYLNEKTGSKFQTTTKSHREYINGRLNKKFTIKDFKLVIDFKVAQWTGTKWAQYLNPYSLFRDSKFEIHLNAAKNKPKSMTERIKEMDI